MKKISNEEVKSILNKRGYELVGEYKGTNTPMKAKFGDYYVDVTLSHLKNGEKPIMFGVKCKYYKENIKTFISKYNDDIEFIDAQLIKKSGKSRMLVSLKCKCGNNFKNTWSFIYNKKTNIGCKNCCDKLSRKKRKSNYTKKYYNDIVNAGFELINKNVQLYANELTEVVQVETGYRGFLYPNRAKELKTILLFSPKYNKDNILYNVNTYIKNNNINSIAMELLDCSIGKSPFVRFKCECGETFDRDVNNFMSGSVFCKKCTAAYSNNELYVASFLKDNKIEFEQEFRINSCRDIYPLPFDFYLPKYNVFIEVDGEQHYKPTNFSGNLTQDELLSKLDSVKRRDNIKNEYCKKWNIPLLRISYIEIHNNTYKEKILNFIQTVEK